MYVTSRLPVAREIQMTHLEYVLKGIRRVGAYSSSEHQINGKTTNYSSSSQEAVF